MKEHDAVAAVSDVSEVLASLPVSSQLDLVELLVRRTALRNDSRNDSGPSGTNGPTGTLKPRRRSEGPWDKVALAIERAREEAENQGRPSFNNDNPPRSTSLQRPMLSESTASVRIPEEVRPIIDILHKLQESQAAGLFANLNIKVELDSNIENTIITNATSRLDPQQLITPHQPQSTTQQPFRVVREQILTILLHAPVVMLRPSPPTLPNQVPKPDDPHSPLALVLNASSSLAALIEAIVLAHNDQILSRLNNHQGLEEYQRISESVWEATSGILKDVKKLKEGPPVGGSWSQAQYLYAHLIQISTQFALGLEAYVVFANNTLPKLATTLNARNLAGLAVVSPPDTPPVSRTPGEATPASEAVPSVADRLLKQKSLGARLMHRLSQLTDNGVKRSSTGSNSSDGTSEGSQPTRYSRQTDISPGLASDADAINNMRRPNSWDIPRRERSVEAPRQTLSPSSAAPHLQVGRSSLDALRPRTGTDGGKDNSDASELLPKRYSSLPPPTLPEISRGHYKAAQWLMEVSEFESRASARGSSIGTRSAATSPPNSPPMSPLSRGETSRRPSPSPQLPTIITPSESLSEITLPRKKRHSRNLSDSSISSAKVRLLQAESWKIKLPTDTDGDYGLGDTDRWSRMMDNIIKGESDSLYSIEANDGDDLKPSDRIAGDFRARKKDAGANTEKELGIKVESTEADEASVRERNSKHRFESLKILESRASHRIPMFDSTGRRIGVLDHGRFVTGVDDDMDVTGTEFISVRGNLLRLSEDGSDVLVMEMVNGKLQIVAGTLEKLITRLADENLQDADFVDIFLENHPFYISSRDLLSNLIARFYVQPPSGAVVDAETVKWQRPIRVKVIAVLSRWVKLRFEDFEADELLRDALDRFLEEIEVEEGFRNEADRIRRVATVQAMTICNRSRMAPFASAARLPTCPFPTTPTAPLSETSPLLNFEARQLARYLTVADARAFRSITMCDFVSKLRNRLDTENAVPATKRVLGRIDLFAQRSDMIRNWVTLELCTLSPRKPRRKLLEKLILVAYHCRAHGNFHTSLFILLALQSPPVQRLRRTWDGVSTPTMEKLKVLEKLLDVSGNMRELRRALDSSSGVGADGEIGGGAGGVVPFLPVVMKDATFVVEGNPEYVTRMEVVRELTNDLDDDTNIGRTRSPSPSHQGRPPLPLTSPLTIDPHDPTIQDLTPATAPPPLVNFDKYRTLAGILGRYMANVERYTWAIHLHVPLPNSVSSVSLLQAAAAAVTSPPPPLLSTATNPHLSHGSNSSSSSSGMYPPPLPPITTTSLPVTVIPPGPVSPASITLTGGALPITRPAATMMAPPVAALTTVPPPTASAVAGQGEPEIDVDLKDVVEMRLAWAADSVLGPDGAWMKIAAELAARCAGEDES
ncbi:hypothetical protein PhCBS80983_g01074 [Powellomyces hirtus]|uniref:Ras-GEF domain-containing protein n=1 Tax=Powellomyces hirtus TaxID=109895 RepID=A0A507EDS2_9FUNG|nr:hypothetical protein PhCBS80983_g01074 [Powellomyces hirtus]